MKIIVSQSAGFCYGVKRAIEMCKDAAAQHERCVTLGPIIHNRHVIENLSGQGIRIASDVSEVSPGDTVIIRSHGARCEECEALNQIGANVIDATCPDVKKIHDIVRKDSAGGRFIIVIGERNHPEVLGICSRCSQYEVFDSPQQLAQWLGMDKNAEMPVSVIFQTTNMRSTFDKFVTVIKKECTNPIIYDTVCNATNRRQAEAEEISKNADTVIIIGDTGSSNSLKLAQICRKHCSRVYFVQSKDDIEPSMFISSEVTGVTSGASTPAFIIKEVIAKMEELKITDGTIAEQDSAAGAAKPETLPVPEEENKTEETPVAPEALTAPEEDIKHEAVAKTDAETDAAAESAPGEPEPEPVSSAASSEASAESGDLPAEVDEDESFEALLEKSIKTFRTGEKVSGIVTSITATEISVDLGAKQSGYIPISEFTDDSNADINDIVNVGDAIEAYITRVNDVEGMIILSKKRLDAARNWDVVTAAKDNREVVQGFVIQENRGGVVVNVKGVHVFIPASQTGLSKNEPMSDLLKKTVKLRINEVNQSRRRVIGSIRDAQKDERREKSEKLWNEIEVGKQYDGVVKSMTSYGVFVDIGGVDGMIHISELSWKRIKQPSEVMSVGDEVSVFVISFDRESRKISLGYKKGEDNPWNKFTSEYSAGDVISVKIVKMMPFGAFAEICPGVDGLIHISQIAEHRIGLPSEVLSEGQTVDVKITEIDNDRKKVSLSIRALMEPVNELELEAAEDEASAEVPEVEVVSEPPAVEETAPADVEEAAKPEKEPESEAAE